MRIQHDIVSVVALEQLVMTSLRQLQFIKLLSYQILRQFLLTIFILINLLSSFLERGRLADIRQMCIFL